MDIPLNLLFSNIFSKHFKVVSYMHLEEANKFSVYAAIDNEKYWFDFALDQVNDWIDKKTFNDEVALVIERTIKPKV